MAHSEVPGRIHFEPWRARVSPTRSDHAAHIRVAILPSGALLVEAASVDDVDPSDDGLSTAARARLLEAARAGREPDPERARLVRVVEYEVEDRGNAADRELFCLLTTLTDPVAHPASLLAHTYAERWEHETANKILKELLDPAGRMLRSKSPELVEQEVFGLLLTQYTLAALMCRAASEAGLDPDRLSPTRTLRIVRRRIADPAAISP